MHDAERARSALSHLDYNDRAVWVRAAMCLKDGFGDDGFDIWDDWGSNCKSHTAGAAKSVWKSCKVNGKTTIASLFYDAKAAGWKDDKTYKRPSKAEIDRREAEAAKRRAEAAEEERLEREAAAVHAVQLWEQAQPLEGNGHPYLKRKGVQSHGLRLGAWEVIDPETGEVNVISKQALLVPIRDDKKVIHSMQAIFAGKAMGSRDKDMVCGGAVSGHFYSFGKPQMADVAGEQRKVILVGEGYATLASCHEATGHACIVAFTAGNLLPTGRVLRSRFPDAVLVFVADNDSQTVGNPGVTSARKAAKAVGGLVAVPPPGDFNDLHMAQGLDAVADVIAVALNPPEPDDDEVPWGYDEDGEPFPDPELPGENPPIIADENPPIPPAPADAVDEMDTLVSHDGYFSILGYDEDCYYVFHRQSRMVKRVTRANFTDVGIVELAQLNWWEDYFPADGKRGVNRAAAFQWFVETAHKRGVYDPNRVRGRGAWHDAGRLVYHHGDYLTVDGVRVEIGDMESRWVYSMSTSLPALSTPLTDEEGQHLLKVAKMARWTREGSAALLAGWVFLAPVCGALSWRPHIWITGGAGSGKTTLFEHYASRLLYGVGMPLNGDSSGPGIRQEVRMDAVPLLVDEFEPNDEKERNNMRSVLTLARQSSSETSARTVKGTANGDGVQFHVRSMFCFVSINTALDKDSDQTRVTPLVLKSAAKAGSVDDSWPKFQEELHKLERRSDWSSRMLTRAIGMMPELLENIDVFCRVSAKIFGSQRLGDQYGTMLAGAWSLTNSKVATEAEATAMINSYDWTEHTDISSGLADPEKALQSIMESKLRVSMTDVTVHEVLSEACGFPSGSLVMGRDVCIDILKRNGIRVEGSTLLFGVNTNSLKALVKDTPYATDLRGQLSRLPGASNMGNKTRKFSGVGSKLIGVPLSLVLDDEPLL